MQRNPSTDPFGAHRINGPLVGRSAHTVGSKTDVVHCGARSRRTSLGSTLTTVISLGTLMDDLKPRFSGFGDQMNNERFAHRCNARHMGLDTDSVRRQIAHVTRWTGQNDHCRGRAGLPTVRSGHDWNLGEGFLGDDGFDLDRHGDGCLQRTLYCTRFGGDGQFKDLCFF